MPPPTTKPPAFASFSLALLAMAIFFALASGEPAAAQGINFVAAQPSAHPAHLSSFALLNSAMSLTPPVLPTNHLHIFTGESIFRITENLPSRNLATLFPYQETKNSFVTEVHVPVGEFHLPVPQLRGTSLRFGFFMQTLHNSDVALGPLVATQALHSFSQPRSASLYGVGVSIPLGRQAHGDISQSLPWAAIRDFLQDR